MIEIPSSSLKEDCTDIPQVAQDNLDDILDDILLGQYDANFNCNQLVCSLLDQVCQALEEELQYYQTLEDDLGIDLAVLHADLDWDDAIFENIPEEEQQDGKSQIKESLVPLQHLVNVGEELRRKFGPLKFQRGLLNPIPGLGRIIPANLMQPSQAGMKAT